MGFDQFCLFNREGADLEHFPSPPPRPSGTPPKEGNEGVAAGRGRGNLNGRKAVAKAKE